ncbi:class I histocompatibility antigen, F10 alpha chain-like isoform X1 [Aquarana catesbeiana]|uniref:class I histocompatibility antigen, F10 alpha chain-like isoform X1 n=1 Tax=Aquarana catesbeiana TaxID=8400 RepID=UPI003CCA3BFC
MDLLRCLLINCPWLLMAWAESHSLNYYGTAISNPIGFPQFSFKVYIDDVMLASYDDDTQIFQSRLKGPVNAEYWIDQTSDSQHFIWLQKQKINYVNSLLNLTNGEYLYQQKRGCTVDDDGNIAGYLEFAHEGKEFLKFDKEKMLYIPMIFYAEPITQYYNTQTADSFFDKNYLEIQCPKMLHSYLKYASYELDKKVHPEVKVWGYLQSDGLTRLHCMVYGFYPRPVEVKWVRNGEDDVPSDEMSPILPHPDGTYQIRVSVEVPTREGDAYSCHVDHSSLKEILIVNWEPGKKERRQYIGMAVAVLFILSGFGISIYRFRLQNMGEV